MLQPLLERGYRRLGPRYLLRALFLQMQLVYVVIVGMVALLSTYVEMSLGEFVRLALLACGLQLAYNVLDICVTRRLTAPLHATKKVPAPALPAAIASKPRRAKPSSSSSSER
jgi:hypothetical protein